MNDKIKRAEILARACKKFKCIDTAEDLKRQHLTPVEYNILEGILKTFASRDSSITLCLSEDIAAWYGKNGFRIIPPHDTQVNYIISLP